MECFRVCFFFGCSLGEKLDELLFIVNETWCCCPLSSWDLKRRASLLFIQMPFDATWTTARSEKTQMKCRHNYDCYPPRGSADEARHLIIVEIRPENTVCLPKWCFCFSVFLSETVGLQYVTRGHKLPLFSFKDMKEQLHVDFCYICCWLVLNF